MNDINFHEIKNYFVDGWEEIGGEILTIIAHSKLVHAHNIEEILYECQNMDNKESIDMIIIYDKYKNPCISFNLSELNRVIPQINNEIFENEISKLEK